MALTNAQLQTLKTAIDADPALSSQPMTSDGAFAIAAAMNLDSDPAVIVWRKAIPAMEMGKTVIYDALAAMTSANTSRVSLFMDLNRDSFDGSADLDAYFADTFGGALNGQGANCRAALAAMLRRTATRAEALYATGAGTSNDPSTLVVEGEIIYQDVERARAL